MTASQIEHAAVVTGENDQRVVRNAGRLEALHHLADDPVELMDEVAVELRLAASPETASPG